MVVSVSAVICSKNEEKSIRDIILRTKKHVDEILVIDGHSTDKSTSIARSLGCRVIKDGGKGKGQAVRLGLSRCSGRYIVLLDADGSHRPEEIPTLLAPLISGKADLVVASRTLGSSEELNGTLDATMRDWFGRVINTVINLRFRANVTDSQNGFRALRREIIPLLGLSENSFTIEQQMTIRCIKKGLRIVELPSLELRRRHGKSHISLLRHGPRYAWCLLRETLT